MVQIVSREVRGIKVPDIAIFVQQVSRELNENGEMQEITQKTGNSESGIIGETVKGVYILKGSEVIFRRLDDRDIIAHFDGYVLYKEPDQREDGSTTTLQAFEDIITAGKDLYDGKIIN
jgi:restriction endonuclease